MTPEEKHDMRAGRPADEILYVVMCLVFSLLIAAGSAVVFFSEGDTTFFKRGVFMLGSLMNFLMAVRSLTRGRRMTGGFFIAASLLCGLLVFI
ncbi:MAG: hypothetical protein K6E30_07205 [Lachnospiraceae bacterium]|nr:hypothetical protein [Lachnospiraceae bacterium]